IFHNIRELGEVTGRVNQADQWVTGAQMKLSAIRSRMMGMQRRPRVFYLEWVDPIYCGGHWIPEMVSIAGGFDPLGRRGTDSIRISWSQVVKSDPEVLILAPCGFHLTEAVKAVQPLRSQPGWHRLRAVQTGRVFVVDASSYFARPGPRVIDGIQLLAHL